GPLVCRLRRPPLLAVRPLPDHLPRLRPRLRRRAPGGGKRGLPGGMAGAPADADRPRASGPGPAPAGCPAPVLRDPGRPLRRRQGLRGEPAAGAVGPLLVGPVACPDAL